MYGACDLSRTLRYVPYVPLLSPGRGLQSFLASLLCSSRLFHIPPGHTKTGSAAQRLEDYRADIRPENPRLTSHALSSPPQGD